MALYTSISVSPSSREINGSNAFTVSINYSITASRLINTKVTVAGQTYSIGTVTSSSFTWTPPVSLLTSMPSLSSATVTITGTPANSNNTSLVGEISTYCTVTVPASYVPSAPKNITLTRVDDGVPPAWGVYVQNKSKMNVSWTAASGTGGATINHYRIYIDTNTYYTAAGNATSIANLGPFSAGTKTVTIVAVDSRGRTATSSGIAYTVQAYSNPVVSAHKIDRTTAAGVVDNLAAYMKANVTYAFASVGGKNTASATFAYKSTGSSTYSAETAIAQSTDKIFGGSFLSTTAYHVRFTIKDALGSTTTYVVTVDSLKLALEFESSANQLWVHCPLTVNNVATCNDLITSGGHSHLMLNGQSYISLRTGGTERGYFHSGGFQVVGSLAATGTVSGNSLSITNGAACNNLEAYNTITCQNLSAYNLISSGGGSHLTLRGASYISFQTGSTERGYFHSGGLQMPGTVSCTNLSVTNPPWPTSVALPSALTADTLNLSAGSTQLNMKGINIVSFNTSSNIVIGWGNGSGGSGINYLDLHSQYRVRFYNNNSVRAYVDAGGIVNSSLAELKSDIRPAAGALSVIKDARLYQYRYISMRNEAQEPDAQTTNAGKAKRPNEHLGFVIGEGYAPPPDCVLSEAGDGVNIYAMTSVCWKGLQELLARVDALENRPVK